MASVILHMNKFKRKDIRGLQSHNQRERISRSNPDIDYSRSSQNYDLVRTEQIDFMKFIENRIGELNLSKATRHDAVYACGLIFSASPEYFEGINDAAQRRYFEVGLEYLGKFIGRENIISAVVHLDEGNPHMHMLHVPVTEEGRLSANKIYTRESLRKLQDELPKYLQKMGLNVSRGVEQKPGSAKKHLATREYKQQREEEKRMELELAKLTDQLGAIKSDLTDKTREQKELDRQAQEAEAMLQSSPEVAPPTLLNYKSSFEGLKKQHELLKTALANKRAVESRLLDAETGRNKLAKELKLSQILLNQERINRGAAQQKEKRMVEHLEQEKQSRDATQRSLNEFLNQPEISDALKQFQAQEKSQEAAVTLPAIQLHEDRQPLPNAPEKSSFTPGR